MSRSARDLGTIRRGGGLLAVLGVALVLAVLLTGRGSGAAEGAVRVGELSVSGAVLPRPASPDVASVYLTVRNDGSAPDSLLSASTDAAGSVSLMQEQPGGTMTDSGAVVVAAHSTLALAPGLRHLMLAEPRPGLREGQTVTVTLVFARSGPVTLPVRVTATGSRP